MLGGGIKKKRKMERLRTKERRKIRRKRNEMRTRTVSRQTKKRKRRKRRKKQRKMRMARKALHWVAMNRPLHSNCYQYRHRRQCYHPRIHERQPLTKRPRRCQ